MAIVTKYFSTTSAGAGDGSSWADRAALFSGGNWTSEITGFDFSGDSLKCFVGPGSYTCSQLLQSSSFANPPTVANHLVVAACDGSGSALAIPDPDWVSAMPAWDDSALPVIATTTDISTANVGWWHLMKFTASGRNGSIVSDGMLTWCVVINSTANSSARAVATAIGQGCVFKCTGSSYDTVCQVTSVGAFVNDRIEGVAGSSGNRRGLTLTTNSTTAELLTVVNCGGEGVISTSTSTAQAIQLSRCVIANNGGAGFKSNNTASQASRFHATHCMITGNGAAGIDGNSDAGRFLIFANRLRDNSGGNFTGLGNYPTDINNHTTDSDDGTEYVSTGANGDFRIKKTAAIWGQGFGAGDQPAAGGGTGRRPRLVTIS